jgi:hypothetical protein
MTIAFAAIMLVWGTQAQAQTPARVTAGAVVWTGDTDLSVKSATDWDGTSRTAQASANSWNTVGSGMGARIGYAFPGLVSIYGEVGMAQTTVRSRDLTDLSVTSRGLDAGAFFGAGLRLGNDFPNSPMFWSAGADVRRLSSDLQEDSMNSWAYDQTDLSADGRIGSHVHGIGIYGGVRMAQLSSDLEQTDLSRPVGQQTRTTNLNRDGKMDLLLGAQTGAGSYNGFAELAFVGTTTATAGVSVHF